MCELDFLLNNNNTDKVEQEIWTFFIAKGYLNRDRLEEILDAAPYTQWKDHCENA